MMNPILDRHICVPDAEARSLHGRLYLYGSLDIEGAQFYCSRQFKVFSTDDMIHWTDHGISFDTAELRGTPIDNQMLYAPDCIEKDGKYYLYAGTSQAVEVVAVSDTPWGKFENPQVIDTLGHSGIDPAVFIDDDGQAYYFWGQFNLCGAKLQNDMKTLDPESLNTGVLNEYTHDFHEGACIRKRNGIYYLIYTDISRSRASCLAYATSDKPLTGYKKRGIIIDNTGCDPKTWNNHGSICEFLGKWYVFYHRSSKNSIFSRRVCVEEITFNDDGTISEVPMTMSGVEKSVSSYRKTDAYRASHMNGGIHTCLSCDGTEYLNLTNIENGSFASFKYLAFDGHEKHFYAELIEGSGQTEIEISTGSFIGQHFIGRATSGDGNIAFCSVSAVQDTNTVYLRFQRTADKKKAAGLVRFWFE